MRKQEKLASRPTRKPVILSRYGPAAEPAWDLFQDAFELLQKSIYQRFRISIDGPVMAFLTVWHRGCNVGNRDEKIARNGSTHNAERTEQ